MSLEPSVSLCASVPLNPECHGCPYCLRTLRQSGHSDTKTLGALRALSALKTPSSTKNIQNDRNIEPRHSGTKVLKAWGRQGTKDTKTH